MLARVTVKCLPQLRPPSYVTFIYPCLEMFLARDISVSSFLHSNYYHRQGLRTFFRFGCFCIQGTIFRPWSSNREPTYSFYSSFFFQIYANPESHLRAWCQCALSLHIWGVLPSSSRAPLWSKSPPVSSQFRIIAPFDYNVQSTPLVSLFMNH